MQTLQVDGRPPHALVQDNPHQIGDGVRAVARAADRGSEGRHEVAKRIALPLPILEDPPAIGCQPAAFASPPRWAGAAREATTRMKLAVRAMRGGIVTDPLPIFGGIMPPPRCGT
jgi:hypothetical protein